MQIVPSMLKLHEICVPKEFHYESRWKLGVGLVFLRPPELTTLCRFFLRLPRTSQNQNQNLCKSLKCDTAPVLSIFVPILFVLRLRSACLLKYYLGKSLEFCSSCKSRIKTHKKRFVISLAWHGDLSFPVRLELLVICWATWPPTGHTRWCHRIWKATRLHWLRRELLS